MKSVAELYEVWCLLEIRRMLMNLGFSEVEIRTAALRTKCLEKDLVDGMGTAFRFTRRDGLKIRLAHEPPFSVTKNSEAKGIYSWTTPQKPDILLEATFPDGSRIRWIFDAKYRIAAEDGDDLIPDDAINQMHRYRDALIHLTAGDDGVTEKSRPVVGAFVLYPGWFDEGAEENPYGKAIEAVGIGGFPLLPGRDNSWLFAFLKEKFGDLFHEGSQERALAPDEHLLHDSVRIAPTGLSLSRYDDLTLVASLGNVAKREKQYVDHFMNGTAGWYHIPASTTDKKISRAIMRELRFCAVATHPAGTGERSIEYLYEITSAQLVKRCKITAEQAGNIDPENQNEYWLLKFGASRLLPVAFNAGGLRTFRFRLTGATELLAAQNWSDLSERYVSFIKKSEAGM
ncbi:MAG: nuclease domain-containing protein [Desulfuromonadales bacterium]